MKKLKGLSKFILMCLVSVNLFSMPISAAETSTDSMVGINIDSVSISIGDNAKFSFIKDDNETYSIISSNKAVIGELSLSFESVNLYKKLSECEKSNFISSNAIYTDLSYDDSGEVAILKYKVDDIRHIVYMNGDTSISFVGVGSNSLTSNDNVQKIIKNVNISM